MKILFAVAFAFAIAVPSEAATLGSCESVDRQIREKGAHQVLENLWANHEQLFGKLVAHAQAAEPCWLKIANSIRAVSDAGASEELDEAFSRALLVHPARILPFLSSEHGFTTEVVCSGNQVDIDKTSAVHRKWLKQARAAVKDAHLPSSLEKTREQCLAAIAKEEHN